MAARVRLLLRRRGFDWLAGQSIKTPAAWQRWWGDRGAALVIAMMAIALMMSLGTALVLTTMTEGRIASSHRDGIEALYAADAGIQRAIVDLTTIADWNTLLSGAAPSSFVDGPAAGPRKLPDGRTFNLTEATNLLRCGKVTACGDADLNARTEERPWAMNNPRWQPFAYGPLAALLPAGAVDSLMYVVVWVADDPSETDDDPVHDGSTCAGGAGCRNPGKDIIAMRAHAYGPGSMMRVVQVSVARATPLADAEPTSTVEPAAVKVLSWRELR